MRPWRFDIRQAQRPLLVVLVALLVANTAVYLALVRPKVQEFRTLSAENNPRIQALRAKQRQVEQLEAFVDGLAQAHDDLKTLREDVLSTRARRMIAAQEEVEDLCGRFNLDLDLVTYEFEDLGSEGLEVMRVNVPLEGGYAALRRFLQAVESSDKFLVVERVTLGQGKEGGVLLLLNITLATYFDLPGESELEVDRRRRT